MSFDVQRAFGYYEVDEDTEDTLDYFVDKFSELAELILAHVPENREQSLALTNLEQAWQWVDSAMSPIGVP